MASVDTPVSIAKDSFKGPIGVVVGYDDPVLTAKKALEYSKKNEKLKISSGIIEGRFCKTDDIKAVAVLPPKKVLQSIVAGLLSSPLSKLAAALSATINNIAYAIEALKRKREE